MRRYPHPPHRMACGSWARPCGHSWDSHAGLVKGVWCQHVWPAGLRSRVCSRAVRTPRLLCSGPPVPSHRPVRSLPLHGVCVVGVMQVWASSPKACWSPAASGREAGTWAAAQPPVPSLGTRVPGWQREGFRWTRRSLPPTRGAGCPHVPAAGPLLSPGCWNQPLEKCVLGNSTGM